LTPDALETLFAKGTASKNSQAGEAFKVSTA
jgi:hypothetical protein